MTAGRGQVVVVAEDSVACLRQANQPCGGGRELAREILNNWQGAHRIVFPRQDQRR